MHSWIAASMSPSHRRREKDSRRKGHNVANREHKSSHGTESLDPDLLCKILQSNIAKDGSKDPSRPSSLLSPSYNTLSKSCDDMSKCGSSDAGSNSEEVDKVPMPLETIINDKKYIGLVPAAYVSRSKSHNDIIIHRRLVTPNRSKTASPSALPSAYMEERYVIRIKKGAHHPHKLHKSSSEFLKPTNELCRSFSAQNLNADSGRSNHGGGGMDGGEGGGGGGGNHHHHHRHEIITTFGCAPNSAPSSREVSPESVFQKDSANGNFPQQHSHHSQHHPHGLSHHELNLQHHSEKTRRESDHGQEHGSLFNTNNNNNNNNNHHHHHHHHHHHKTSHTTGNIAKTAEQPDKQFHLDLPRPERRHSFVGGQTSYPVSIKSPIRSTDTHSFLSMDGLKKLLSPGGKKIHKEVK